MKSRPTLFWLLFGMAYILGAAFVFTCVICGIPLIIYEKIAGTQMSRMVGIPFLVVTFVIIMRWGLREANCYFARLDERNLHFGLINRTTLPFSEIQAIVIGMWRQYVICNQPLQSLSFNNIQRLLLINSGRKCRFSVQ